MSEQKRCNEIAKITLPWGNEIVNYCPVHANQLVMIGSAMGHNLKAQLLPETSSMQCESLSPLTDKEKQLNKEFSIK